MVLDPIARVTDRIRSRSADSRRTYLTRIEALIARGVHRDAVGCANLAHAIAGCARADQDDLKRGDKRNIAIVTSYNDMLSAHQPFEAYPALIKAAIRSAGGVAQVAGGVPAMCDGVTQGREGMELSLFSRDVIAMATAIALSHDVFDGALLLGVCDKIVPGLLIAALSFGHLPTIFIPAGPMPSGISNGEKSRIRQLYATGEASRAELLDAETAAYHAPGTCTFYGTANSNQMLMEIMGLHLPGASFVNPNTALRTALTQAAAERILTITARGDEFTPIGVMIDERSMVNGMIGLLATGGSTNHTIHLIAMARAAGIQITWQDFSDLSECIPSLTRIYPNGAADVNQFQAAGGMAVLIATLLDHHMLHGDARTVWSEAGLAAYRSQPALVDQALRWLPAPARSRDTTILRSADAPFSADGGLKIMRGMLGEAVAKISAVKAEHRVVEAPARVFRSQEAMQAAFKAGELHRDVVVVVTHQGPQANGMPELHKLTPPLSVLQDLGYRVALVTDGRMSGASGKIPAAIHVTPEASMGGPIARLRDGDIVRVDCAIGTLTALVDHAEFSARPLPEIDLSAHHAGLGRELFNSFRHAVSGADLGASAFA
jgi:phosphogluconate dehydratase